MDLAIASSNSPKKQFREYDECSSGSPHYAEVQEDWEHKEIPRHSATSLHRELEEARQRTAQMEKTMRWWSDCTSNWREKWCEVRDERNKFKKECKILRAKLDAACKDIQCYKKENKRLDAKNLELKKELGRLKNANQQTSHSDPVSEADLNSVTINESFMLHDNNAKRNEIFASLQSHKNSSKDACNNPDKRDILIQNYISQGALPKRPNDKRRSKCETVDEEALLQKISSLTASLDDATKIIFAEREEKAMLEQKVGALKTEMLRLREKCKITRGSQAEAMKEFMESKDHCKMSSDSLTENTDISSNCDKENRLAEMRAELERLQIDNSIEWGKREQLENEKLALERENKQLKNELYELHERMEEKRSKFDINSCDIIDSKKLQQDYSDRNKDLIDLKHSYAKLKKLLTDKTTELAHAFRRCEHYEAEQKRLRARVEELKKDLANIQDEVDCANNSVRKLRHVNEDLSEQLEIYKKKCQKFNILESQAPDVVSEIRNDSGRRCQNSKRTNRGIEN